MRILVPILAALLLSACGGAGQAPPADPTEQVRTQRRAPPRPRVRKREGQRRGCERLGQLRALREGLFDWSEPGAPCAREAPAPRPRPAAWLIPPP